LLGEHNRANALAAIAAARHSGVVAGAACEALGRFGNVKRRMELRGTAAGVTVYDDFAHHPTAIATTVAGLRRKVGKARILAVLEPRSNTMKAGVMKDRLAASLAGADRVVLGSDHPADMGCVEPARDIERLTELPVADRDLILGGTAARLLKIT